MKILALLALAAAPAFCGTEFAVTVDTSPIATRAGFLAFDLIGGSPFQNNTLAVTLFSTNGTLGSGSGSGTFTGNLVPGPLSLATSANFFNEWLQAITYGTSLTFHFNLSNNFSGGTPDQFSFFLLDSSKIPFPTSDPTGADSAFAVDVFSTLSPAVFTSDSFTVNV